ncbi:MAG: ATP-binding protein [Caulobacterales bacterium]
MSTQAAGGGSLSEDARLFLASARNLTNRFVTLTITIGAALPILPLSVVAVWGAWVLVWAAVESRLANVVQRRSAEGHSTFAVVAAAFAAARAPYSVIAALFWQSGTPTAQLFSIVILCVSLLYSLMQLYPKPSLFLLAISPHLAALGYLFGGLALRDIRHGAPLTAVTVLMSAAALYHFFSIARAQLATSRSLLREARAKAVQHGVEAEAATRAKSTFLAVMSHEIRTPLNGIMGMAQALSFDTLTERQRQQVSIIRESGDALLSILNDVLDLSKIEAGKLDLEEIEFDIDDLVRGAHAAFTALANKKGLDFNLSIGRQARGVYLGDPTRVRQIVYNLISNALKFTDAGEVRVLVDRVDGRLTIAVSDTGVGISADQIHLLFDKFVQADASTTRRFGGTGLGLSICFELVQAMSGAITPTSEVDKGSTFTVSLPLPRIGEPRSSDTQDEAAQSPTPAQPAPNASAEVRVLAAEDNAMNQLVLKTLLAEMGISPTVVANGEEAVEAWATGQWDAILMDVQMPVMDGPTATRIIREREATSGRARTPIIALTANVMSHQVLEYVASGMDGHVAKPIEAGKLFEALDAVLAGEEDAADQGAVQAAAG